MSAALHDATVFPPVHGDVPQEHVKSPMQQACP
jgi:hypothetical protein